MGNPLSRKKYFIQNLLTSYAEIKRTYQTFQSFNKPVKDPQVSWHGGGAGLGHCSSKQPATVNVPQVEVLHNDDWLGGGLGTIMSNLTQYLREVVLKFPMLKLTGACIMCRHFNLHFNGHFCRSPRTPEICNVALDDMYAIRGSIHRPLLRSASEAMKAFGESFVRRCLNYVAIWRFFDNTCRNEKKITHASRVKISIHLHIRAYFKSGNQIRSCHKS